MAMNFRLEMNRHPADELAEIRPMLAALKAREAELRQRLLTGNDLRGDGWRAHIQVQSRERLDVAAVKQHFASEVLEPFMVKSDIPVIKLTRIIGRPELGFPKLEAVPHSVEQSQPA
jgi:hypothetical protein